jgi:hypothetical protein
VDGKAFRGSVIEEGNLVGDIHANWISNECFAALNIPDNERVVVLATKRGKVFFVEGERKALDENLMQLKSMHHLKGIEVPNNDVRLEAHVSLLS